MITVNDLKHMVVNGAIIRWCGAITNGELIVEVVTQGSSMMYNVDVDSELDLIGSAGVVRNGEADEPMSIIKPIPPNTDFFAVLRKASVLGINISGTCEKGSAQMYKSVDGCVCGYDLELDLRGQERGTFPLPSVPILSAALWCTCGYKAFITIMDCDLENCVPNCTQSELVSKTIELIFHHKPLWLVGWNCYSFDNTCLVFHAPDEYISAFKRVKVGSAGDVDYGYIMNIPGVYNVDAFGYLQRNPSHSSRFPDLSLYGVAKVKGTKMKTEMPDLYATPSPREVMDYNMNDSAIAAELWVTTGLNVEVPSLAVCACAPVYDCIRYMTGAMAGCALSSDAAALDMLVDWSKCERVLKYEGGKVLEPIRGVHDDVVICDYTSMYPTIMTDARISPETIIIIEPTGRPYGDVWYDDTTIYVELDDHVATFPREGDTIQRQGLLKMMKTRNMCKKSNPTYAGALKVTSNSAYGAMGYQNSPMYSPSCSSSVTAIGRFCLDVASKCFSDCGMKVIYGDTDSCFMAATAVTKTMFSGDVKIHAEYCLRILNERLSTTPFNNMRMALESIHRRVLLVDKKHYCKVEEDENILYKGLSVVRRDKLGICKDGCRISCEALLMSNTLQEARNTIARFICNAVEMGMTNKFSASDVSMVAKRDQKRCYIYKGKDGQERKLPVDMGSNVPVDYDVEHVLHLLRKEIERISGPCGLGNTYDVVSASDVLF